ncbi:ANTAR domain-containing protein [Streptomyces sp. NBC_01239]|uniref:ANTAR domain-containing protein n=1 Tax=Streptomyces sp. NBC_01239 TaxID=2903792 RepID=UPI002253F536|nr:ANTAR domain-containing protein [Streptomyces sp. NBC_01239]MCX4811934.1 ANTAR domain-containing protein [Streptomyces sp. NBC_01239]
MRHATCTTHQPTTTRAERPQLTVVPPPAETDLLAELDQLRAQNAQLLLALETRAVIDQARGMVMALAPCSGDRAWDLLVDVSQHCNIKLRVVATALVATTADESLPAPIQRELRRALRLLHAAART